MTAVEGGHMEIVQVLLKPDYQCDTNIQEKVFHNQKAHLPQPIPKLGKPSQCLLRHTPFSHAKGRAT